VSRWDSPAAWYDVLNPWGPSDDFYLGLVMSADRVLDVGCGTGRLLHRARDAGHAGRLCGLDPDPAMLDQARARTDIEWVLADAGSAAWDREFDLAVMASHAFQVFVEDDQLRASLSAIRASLVDDGRFAFETRDPRARAWEGWNTSFEVRNPAGEVARVEYEVEDVKGDVVWLTETLSGRWWERALRQSVGGCGSSAPNHSRRFCTRPGSSSTSSSAIGVGVRSRKRAKRSSQSRGVCPFRLSL
jgi:SAM-dependent methyltransferase